MSIDATPVGMVLPQYILNLEMSLKSPTTAGRSIAEGYFSFRLLFKARIRQGQVQRGIYPRGKKWLIDPTHSTPRRVMDELAEKGMASAS